ncbi:MAG: nucleotide exchange factor GrpE [Christensenellales bacterium]
MSKHKYNGENRQRFKEENEQAEQMEKYGTCNCESESECNCESECGCDETCGCENECECDETCDCGCDCDCEVCDDEVAQTANEYLDMAKRLQAEFDNYRKRNQDAVKQAREEGKASVIMSILPCADAIERAIKMTEDKSVLQGLKMVDEKFSEVLTGLGVSKMQSLGQIYDPNLHNVLSSIEVEGKQSGEIIDEYACGYYFNDKVLRFAQVVIAK